MINDLMNKSTNERFEELKKMGQILGILNSVEQEKNDKKPNSQQNLKNNFYSSLPYVYQGYLLGNNLFNQNNNIYQMNSISLLNQSNTISNLNINNMMSIPANYNSQGPLDFNYFSNQSYQSPLNYYINYFNNNLINIYNQNKK